MISPEDMTAIVRLAAKRGIWVVTDECYVYLDYTGHRFSAGSLTEAKERIVVIGSLSKTYAMTGWRLGIRSWPGAGRQADGEVAEPVHVEPDFHCTESSGGGTERVARVRWTWAPTT